MRSAQVGPIWHINDTSRRGGEIEMRAQFVDVDSRPHIRDGIRNDAGLLGIQEHESPELAIYRDELAEATGIGYAR
jgi:hypothetical protein